MCVGVCTEKQLSWKPWSWQAVSLDLHLSSTTQLLCSAGWLGSLQTHAMACIHTALLRPSLWGHLMSQCNPLLLSLQLQQMTSAFILTFLPPVALKPGLRLQTATLCFSQEEEETERPHFLKMGTLEWSKTKIWFPQKQSDTDINTYLSPLHPTAFLPFLPPMFPAILSFYSVLANFFFLLFFVTLSHSFLLPETLYIFFTFSLSPLPLFLALISFF